MTREQVLYGCVKFMEYMSDVYKLTVDNRGTGHAYDNSFWKDVLVDDSNIPNIVAKNDEMSVELRSFWGRPEIDLRIQREFGEELLVFNYTDKIKVNNEYISTGNYVVGEVRVDSNDGEYKTSINTIYHYIELIEEFITEHDWKMWESD